MSDLYDDARSYLSRHFPGVDLKDVPEDSVQACIEKLYEGGWPAYIADFERFMGRHEDMLKSVRTPLQEFARMRGLVAGSMQVFRLKLHEEVVDVSISDDLCVATIRTCKVETRRSRDRITEIGLKRITYKRASDGLWQRPEVETVAVPVTDDYLTWGRAWTAARVAEDVWQQQTCYRPGTDASPMDGPIRKLEISHEEAFENETFQNPTTR
jgi:hypothetical protein